LSVLSTLAVVGAGASALPAAAGSLAIDFNPSTNYTAEVVSAASPGEVVYAYGYEFTANSNVTVTGLATFDNGSINNIGNDNSSPAGGGLPAPGTTPDHPGDTVSLYAGTIPNSGNPGGSLSGLTPLASEVIGGTSNTPTQQGAFAVLNLTTPVTLTSGDSYFILTTYSLVNFDPVAAFPSTITTNGIDLTLGVAENCSVPSNCVLQSSADPGIFGPDFITATPLPAALPLFAGGLGLMGLVGFRKKRKPTALLAS
jgi:hypothetical protein